MRTRIVTTLVVALGAFGVAAPVVAGPVLSALSGHHVVSQSGNGASVEAGRSYKLVK